MHRLANWQLFAICVLTWGTTWHAITYQLDGTPPTLSVAMRFTLAGVVVLAACAMRGEALRFGWRTHTRFAFQGVMLFGVSYVCVYQAERFLPSGLVAVGYSASPLVAGVAAHALWQAPLGRRFVAGGLLGLAGVALIFAPEFARAAAGADAALGAAFTVGSVLLSSCGSLAASRNRVLGLPFWPALGFGMLYGGLACFAIVAAGSEPLSMPARAAWWLALVYLLLFGSVLTFSCFLTLQNRVGPGPAGAIGVMTPMLALTVSTAFEGYRPGPLAMAGFALALWGNVLMLWRRAPAS